MPDLDPTALRALLDAARPGSLAGSKTHNVIDFGPPPKSPFLVVHGDSVDIETLRDAVLDAIREREAHLARIAELEGAGQSVIDWTAGTECALCWVERGHDPGCPVPALHALVTPEADHD